MYAFVGRLGLAAMLAVAVAGCTDNIDPRGNAPMPDALAQIQPGRVTRSDVVALIGTPATASLFGDDHWYYVSSHFQTVAFYAPEELDRLTTQLASTVAYVESLAELDDEIAAKQVEPMAHAVERTNVFRADLVVPSLPRGEALANAPAHDDECYLVPAVLG